MRFIIEQNMILKRNTVEYRFYLLKIRPEFVYTGFAPVCMLRLRKSLHLVCKQFENTNYPIKYQ